jgi:hypothetical protein
MKIEGLYQNSYDYMNGTVTVKKEWDSIFGDTLKMTTDDLVALVEEALANGRLAMRKPAQRQKYPRICK